ncbi:MAG TPA: shikimate dehydrogenase [bacterium]|nr:shikimate dehydrogenase [bacterium]
MTPTGKPGSFGFVVHPPTLRHVRKAMPAMRYLPEGLVLSLIKYQKPYLISRVRRISSLLGHEIQGFFVVCPLLPTQMLSLETGPVIDRIVAAGRIAERLGAKILGLGGYTSIVGDKGHTVASRLSLAVTSGSAMTAWSSVEAIRRLAKQRGVDLSKSTLAVIGASGSIGTLCTTVLAPAVKRVLINARHQEKLERLRSDIAKSCATEVGVEMDAHRAVAAADLVITTTSAPDALFSADELRSGSIVADVSVPKNISKVEHQRSDVTVVDGGRVKLPGKPEFSVDIGLSRGVVYACMAETMALALEGRFENFSLGDNISPVKVEEIGQIGRKHGFDVWLGESAAEIEEEER